MPERHFETELVHAGERDNRVMGAANTPIFQCTVFEQGPSASYHDIRYPRLNNLPNHQILADKLAALECGQAAVVAGSGMAAISTTLLALLRTGDRVMAQDCLYGGTHQLLWEDLRRLGIEVDVVDGSDPGRWAEACTDRTRVFYTESITNPLMQVADHRAVVEFATERGLVSVIDNTFATPVNFRPLAIGYDLVVHSATKYLNGHSDLTAGAVVGSAHLIKSIKHRLDHLGGCLDPHACYLLHRGLKTLALRVRQQGASALVVARFLEQHPAVSGVNYPGLAGHPHHARARELFSGTGGMLSFTLIGGVDAARSLLDRVQIPLHAPSLGGVESLLIRPAASSHAGVPEAERRKMGISDDLVRMSVGIEHVDDLIADLDSALGG